MWCVGYRSEGFLPPSGPPWEPKEDLGPKHQRGEGVEGDAAADGTIGTPCESHDPCLLSTAIRRVQDRRQVLSRYSQRQTICEIFLVSRVYHSGDWDLGMCLFYLYVTMWAMVQNVLFWKLGYIFVLNYSSPIRGGFYHLILRSAIKILFWMGSITPKKEILLTWVVVKISFCWVRDIGLSDVETYPPIYSTIVNVLSLKS